MAGKKYSQVGWDEGYYTYSLESFSDGSCKGRSFSGLPTERYYILSGPVWFPTVAFLKIRIKCNYVIHSSKSVPFPGWNIGI